MINPYGQRTVLIALWFNTATEENMHWMKSIALTAVLMAVPMFGDDIRLAEPHPIIGKPRQVVIGIDKSYNFV